MEGRFRIHKEFELPIRPLEELSLRSFWSLHGIALLLLERGRSHTGCCFGWCLSATGASQTYFDRELWEHRDRHSRIRSFSASHETRGLSERCNSRVQQCKQEQGQHHGCAESNCSEWKLRLQQCGLEHHQRHHDNDLHDQHTRRGKWDL